MLAEVLLNDMVRLSVTSYKWEESDLQMIPNLEEVPKNSEWMALKAAKTWAEKGSPLVETDLVQLSQPGLLYLIEELSEEK